MLFIFLKKAPFAKVKVFERTTCTLEAKSLNIAHILNKCARKVVSLPRKTLKQWEIYMLHVYSHSHINIRYEWTIKENQTTRWASSKGTLRRWREGYWETTRQGQGYSSRTHWTFAWQRLIRRNGYVQTSPLPQLWHGEEAIFGRRRCSW